jgi:hypothetical protein
LIKELCLHKEIPFCEISGKYFFRASEINFWLKHHCGSRKKIDERQMEVVKIFGVEPLISTKDVMELLDCPRRVIYELRVKIPYYIIGRRIKFRLSDIERYLNKTKVDLWEISTRIGSWRSQLVWPQPTIEERMARESSWERGYIENARPGYVVKTKEFESPDLKDLKESVEEYIRTQINRYNLLGCKYSFNDRLMIYRCEVKWWGLPEGRDDYKIHSAGLSSDNPNKLREKVDKFLKLKVKREDLIDIDYYTWGASFTDRCHQARITYYLPKVRIDKGKEGGGKN